jgi:hypothetical protein
MHPGITIALGDKEFVIPPVTLGMLRNGLLSTMREHDELLAKMRQAPEDGTDQNQEEKYNLMDLKARIVAAALRRNYGASELSDEEIWDRLDLANINLAWMAVLGLSGFNQMGEAAAAKDVGISSPSTDPSPQPTDGPTPR